MARSFDAYSVMRALAESNPLISRLDYPVVSTESEDVILGEFDALREVDIQLNDGTFGHELFDNQDEVAAFAGLQNLLDAVVDSETLFVAPAAYLASNYPEFFPEGIANALEAGDAVEVSFDGGASWTAPLACEDDFYEVVRAYNWQEYIINRDIEKISDAALETIFRAVE